MKALLIASFFIAAQSAFGADTAKLNFVTFYAGYDVAVAGNTLTGSQEHLGYGSGVVDMKRVDGNWAGSFGFNQITSRSLTKRSDTTFDYEFTVLPGGTYDAHVVRKGDKTEVSMMLPNGAITRVTVKDGAYLRGANDIFSMELNKKSGALWTGDAVISNGRAIESSEVTLNSEGALVPDTLVKADPELFVLLYLLPYNFAY
jgi:hypothetical protein